MTHFLTRVGYVSPSRPQRNKQEDESYQLKELKSLKPITNYQMSHDKNLGYLRSWV